MFLWNDHKFDKPHTAHAVYGGSQHAWVNWGPEFKDQADKKLRAYFAAQIGTVLHAKAEFLINKHIKLNKSTAKFAITEALLGAGLSRVEFDPDSYTENFMHYVNDGIGFDMRTEQLLKPFKDSEWFFGTADTIKYSEDKRFLRIHDYKSGSGLVSMDQLYVYACFFLLEYGIRPGDICYETRIYQSDEVVIANPTAEDLLPIITNIQRINQYMNKFQG